MTTVTINKEDYELSLTRGNESRQVRDLANVHGIDWKDAEILIVNYPEKGRALKKSKGFEQLGAHG